MVKALNAIGTVYKLESSQGTILGTITIPYLWADYLCTSDRVSFCIGPIFLDECSSESGPYDTRVTLRHGLLVQSRGSHPDALVLFGATLEEFERLPGCSFAPSAAYLRSIIE